MRRRRWAASSGAGRREDALLGEDVPRVRDAGTDVFDGEAWVLGDDLVEAPSSRDEVEHELDGEARAAHDGLPHEDSWVRGDAVAPDTSHAVEHSAGPSHCHAAVGWTS